MLGRRLMCAMGAFFLLLSTTASGQTDPQAEAAARAIFERANAEMAEGKFAEACPRFEEVRRLMMQHINTGIKLADCYVGLNRTASAWSELSRVRSLAVQQEKADKVALIDEQLTQVMPKVPYLRVDVAPTVAAITGLSIRRGEIELGAGQWGLDLPLDPGTYTLRAEAPGRKAWEQQVEVKLPEGTGEKAPVVVKVEELVLDVSVEPKKPVGGEERPSVARGSSTSGMRIVGIAGMSVGALGLGVGAILGGMALSRYGAANKGHCQENNHCDQVGYDLRNEGISLAHASNWVFAASGVVAATGVLLFALAPGKREEAGARQTSVWVGPGSVGVRGAW